MADFSSLQQKVNALKAKVEQNSISPVYLGSILDDFITQMTAIDMTGLSDDVQAAVNDAAEALAKASSALNTANTAKSAANSASSAAYSALQNANTAKSTADSALTSVNDIINRIGWPSGIAPLNSERLIPSQFIPAEMDDVKEFLGFVELDEPALPSSWAGSESNKGQIFFDTTHSVFVCFASASATPGAPKNYYSNWSPDARLYGEASVNGRIPLSEKLYVDIDNNKLYRWNGSTLVVTGSDLENSIGQPDGIAPLDSNGKIPSRFIPGTMDDVKEFLGLVELDEPALPSSWAGTESNKGQIFFDTSHSVFVCFARSSATPGAPGNYYSNWSPDADLYGEASVNGRIPFSDKVYVDIDSNKSYRWSGSTLAVIGSDLALGYTANTAFPGNEGQTTRQIAQDAYTLAQNANSRVSVNRNEINEITPHVRAASFYNVNLLANRFIPFASLEEALNAVPENMRNNVGGVIITFFMFDGDSILNEWVTYQWQKFNSADWLNVDNWKPFGSPNT